MTIVAAPATALLAVPIVVASESLVASILAALVALPSCLVASSSSKATILATGLATMKPMALNMSRVSCVASLLGLRGREG